MFRLTNCLDSPVVSSAFFGKGTTLQQAIEELELSPEKVVITMQQTHGNSFMDISKNHISSQTEIPHVDALITSNQNHVLSVKVADCLPILIQTTSSSNTPVIAIIHAGRKGTLQNITRDVCEYIKQEYQVKDTVHVWLGPAICTQCYQIDRKADLHFDLKTENTKQITQIFDQDQTKITTDTNCTKCNPKQFNSYRFTGTGVEMNYGFLHIER